MLKFRGFWAANDQCEPPRVSNSSSGTGCRGLMGCMPLSPSRDIAVRPARSGLFLQLACAFFSAQLIAASALADEAQIRRTLQPKLRGAQIESVLPAPVKGLYEVVVRTENGVEVLYADESAKHLFSGELFDTRSDRNLTEERKRKLSAIRFESL